MLKKLVLLGVIVGTSVSLPVLYESNPALFHALLQSGDAEDSAEPQLRLQAVRVAKPRANALSGRKHVILPDEKGHFAARFRLNGRPISALIDTGATLVAINESTAQRIGIRLAASDFRHKVTTANGVTRAAVARIDRMQLGRIYVEGVDAVVLEDRALSTVLIGMSFLSRLDSFKVADGRLLLVQ